MKFTIKAQDLSRALKTCNEIAPMNSSISEGVTGVLIRVADGFATFMSADETNYVSVQVAVDVKEPGEALVRASTVAASATASFEPLGFDGEPNKVNVEKTAKETLKLTGINRKREGKSYPLTRNFPLLNAGFFVETPAFDETKATPFSASYFMEGLAKVSHAASKDVSKLKFNCINLTLTDEQVVFAATDGIQIAEFRKTANVRGLQGSFILGLKFASVINKVINPEKVKDVDLYSQDDLMFLRSGGTVLVGTLLNTTFPEYLQYLQPGRLLKGVFPREDFLSILAGVQPTVDAKSHRIVLEGRNNGTATLSTSSTTGEAESSGLDVETPEDFSFHFDAVLLQEAIRQLRGETFEFYFGRDAAGVLLKSPKDDDFRAFLCTLKKV